MITITLTGTEARVQTTRCVALPPRADKRRYVAALRKLAEEANKQKEEVVVHGFDKGVMETVLWAVAHPPSQAHRA